MVSRDIKIATKKKFRPNVKEYQSKARKITEKIDLKYFKEKTNTSILSSRLEVLFEKGRFKDSEKAQKIIRRYNNVIDLTTKIFLSKTKSLSSAKFISFQKRIDPRKAQVDKVVKDFYRELKKLSREGLKVEFIEDLNPLIDRFLRNFEKKINFKPPKES